MRRTSSTWKELIASPAQSRPEASAVTASALAMSVRRFSSASWKYAATSSPSTTTRRRASSTRSTTETSCRGVSECALRVRGRQRSKVRLRCRSQARKQCPLTTKPAGRQRSPARPATSEPAGDRADHGRLRSLVASSLRNPSRDRPIRPDPRADDRDDRWMKGHHTHSRRSAPRPPPAGLRRAGATQHRLRHVGQHLVRSGLAAAARLHPAPARRARPGALETCGRRPRP